MDLPGGASEVVAFAPNVRRFMALVQSLAADSSKAFFGGFAEIRLGVMDLSDLDVLRSIRGGNVVSEINTEPAGIWTANISCTPRGRRRMVVAVSVVRSSRLRIRNLWWEES